ncbi:hypothetical protein ACFYU9_01215 [Streptomyces sp. NPDC004327]|uniref:hypothetical protein n=1 Tax=Streptomyces sp. NPDC004327 TaxID=3364699 RepID=UPI003696C0FF
MNTQTTTPADVLAATRQRLWEPWIGTNRPPPPPSSAPTTPGSPPRTSSST